MSYVNVAKAVGILGITGIDSREKYNSRTSRQCSREVCITPARLRTWTNY